MNFNQRLENSQMKIIESKKHIQRLKSRTNVVSKVLKKSMKRN